MDLKSFTQLCSDLAAAERQYREAPTHANRSAVGVALRDVQAAFDREMNRAPEPTPSDMQFIRLCNTQLHAYAAWRANPTPHTTREMNEAIAALQAFMRPRVAA